MVKTLFGGGEKLVIYTDGGARGNPGPAAIGVVIGDKHYSDYLGRATNNVAEYQAVIFALKRARALLGKAKAAQTSLEIRLDSELVKKQLAGEYRVKENDLKTLFIDAHNLLFDFREVKFVHVPREQNRLADRLVNIELDRHR